MAAQRREKRSVEWRLWQPACHRRSDVGGRGYVSWVYVNGVDVAGDVWDGGGEGERREEMRKMEAIEQQQQEFPVEQMFYSDSGDMKGRRGKHSGVLPAENRQYQIQHLWERHHKMLRLTLLGWEAKDIATELGCSTATVRNCVNSAIGRKILCEMQATVDDKVVDVAAKLRAMSIKAAEKLEELLDDPDTPRTLQARIAMDNLDRSGHARQINVKGQFSHTVLTAEDISKIMEDAQKAAMEVGEQVVDV